MNVKILSFFLSTIVCIEIQLTEHFIEFVVVETNQLVGTISNVILTVT